MGICNCKYVIILYLKNSIYTKKMRNDQRGLSCSQRWEHVALWRVRGSLEEVRGQARTTKASGRWLGSWQEQYGTETGNGSQAAGGCGRQCGALVKSLDSAARPWI